jgi:hypothetical protein
LILRLVKIGFSVEIVKLILEIDLGHVNAPFISLFQVIA